MCSRLKKMEISRIIKTSLWFQKWWCEEDVRRRAGQSGGDAQVPESWDWVTLRGIGAVGCCSFSVRCDTKRRLWQGLETPSRNRKMSLLQTLATDRQGGRDLARGIHGEEMQLRGCCSGARYGTDVSAHMCTCAGLPPCVGRTAVPWHSQALARIKSTFELWASESSYSQGCFLRLEIYFHFAIQMITNYIVKLSYISTSVRVSVSQSQLHFSNWWKVNYMYSYICNYHT